MTEKKTEVGGMEEEDLRRERRSTEESGRCSAVGDKQRWQKMADECERWIDGENGGSEMAKTADKCGRWIEGENGG